MTRARGRSIRNIAEIAQVARRRLPRRIFDFIDGGADDEVTMNRNRSFRALSLWPRQLVDVSERDLTTTVCNIELKVPILLAPTGLAGLVHSDGELGGARAAARHGTTLILSTGATYSI